MSLALEYAIAGLAIGSTYALVAVGLTLIYGVSRVVNVAHGDFLTVGAFVFVGWATVSWDTNPTVFAIPALLGAALVGAGLGLLVERFLVHPIVKSQVDPERRVLVMTLGLSIVMSNVLLLWFGPTFYRVPVLASGATELGSLLISNQRVVVFVVGALLVGALAAYLRFSRFGLAIRATADSADGARAAGIDTRTVYAATFALGTALAASAGMLIAPITSAFPAMGFAFTIKAFVVVIVGGLGSIPGALIAAYTLGMAESLSVLVFPTGVASIIGPAVMLVVLLVRPWGLLGAKETRL